MKISDVSQTLRSPDENAPNAGSGAHDDQQLTYVNSATPDDLNNNAELTSVIEYALLRSNRGSQKKAIVVTKSDQCGTLA